jgi:hypothetical protein
MLLAGAQAEFGLDPPKFGGDDLGESHLFTAAAIFEGGRKEHEVKNNKSFVVSFVYFVRFVMR